MKAAQAPSGSPRASAGRGPRQALPEVVGEVDLRLGQHLVDDALGQPALGEQGQHSGPCPGHVPLPPGTFRTHLQVDAEQPGEPGLRGAAGQRAQDHARGAVLSSVRWECAC